MYNDMNCTLQQYTTRSSSAGSVLDQPPPMLPETSSRIGSKEYQAVVYLTFCQWEGESTLPFVSGRAKNALLQ